MEGESTARRCFSRKRTLQISMGILLGRIKDGLNWLVELELERCRQTQRERGRLGVQVGDGGLA